MIRNHWRDPHFWSWWWRQRVPGEAKLVAAVVAVSLLGFGGYAAAGGLDTAVAEGSSEPLSPQVTTVEKVLTIRESGRVVTRPVRVVRTIPGRGSTSFSTQVLLNTVTTPGGTYVVTQRDVETVPVVRRVVVTRDGRVRTVIQTRPGSVVTDRRTVTNERVLTSERVVTNERVVTRDRVVTDSVTVRSTETVRETLPVTVVETIVRTATETETVPITVPVPVPVTVTVTVRKD
jgi:hypothetical protein